MRTTEDSGKILIVESSQIIHDGLTLLLKKNFPEFDTVNLKEFGELKVYIEKRDVSLIMINSGIIDSLSSPKDTLNEFSQAKIIGVITNCYQRKHSSVFDDLIYINDNKETIIEIIKTHIQKPATKKILKKDLTSREFEVLRLVVKGYSNKQIADKLFISIHTVVTHRKNITSKLGIKSIAGLAIYAVIENIIDVDDYLE